MHTTLYLVGAGPGDPDLITLKAVKILKKADVVLYDALANPLLLDHCSKECIKVFVGKRKGIHSLTQDQINKKIVEYASKYKVIVRLKGGDPFVFGRASEEIDVAQKHGIKVQSIPGITSAISVPESVLIPLTSRGTNESFWVTTGTTKIDTVSTDLHHAAQSSATVIILMAMSKIEEIMDIFLKYRIPDTPIAIMQDGTKKDGKMLVGTIADIVEKLKVHKLSNPSIIVVGQVVNRHVDYAKLSYEEIQNHLNK